MKRIIAQAPGVTGVLFNVVLVEIGDRYGLDDCLFHDGSLRGARWRGDGCTYTVKHECKALVEFYDSRTKVTEYGQFVSWYAVETLLSPSHKGGINLFGGEPDWVIGVEGMNKVRAAIKETIRD